MKNFQQTPKQRRVAMSRNKAALVSSKPVTQHVGYYQNGYETQSRIKINGASLSLLLAKQEPYAPPSRTLYGHYYGYWL